MCQQGLRHHRGYNMDQGILLELLPEKPARKEEKG